MSKTFTCPACKFVNEVDQPEDIDPVEVQPCARCHIWVYVDTGGVYTAPDVYEKAIVPDWLTAYNKVDNADVETKGRMLFRIEPPITLKDGSKAHHVITSFGLESVMGDEFAGNVFPTSAAGDVMDWAGLYVEGESPTWVWGFLMIAMGSAPDESKILKPS